MSEMLKAAALGIHCRMSLGRGNFIAGATPTPTSDDLANAALKAALPHLIAAIDAVDIGSGSEHYRHGRETMRDDAISAIQDLLNATQPT